MTKKKKRTDAHNIIESHSSHELGAGSHYLRESHQAAETGTEPQNRPDSQLGGEVGAASQSATESHMPRESGSENLFRLVYRMVEDCQRVRLGHANRIRQVLPLIPATVSPPRGHRQWEDFLGTFAVLLQEEEQRLLKLAERLLKDEPVGAWLLAQKGIGPALGVSILGEVWPLTRFQSPRRLWAYAGLHVGDDGKAVKRKKGTKANWNARLKTRLWLFVQSVMKAGGPWREIYDERKRYEYERIGLQGPSDSHIVVEADPPDRGSHSVIASHPSHETANEVAGDTHGVIDNHKTDEFSRLHLHNRAIRFVMKRLLKDLWCVAHDRGTNAAENLT